MLIKKYNKWGYVFFFNYWRSTLEMNLVYLLSFFTHTEVHKIVSFISLNQTKKVYKILNE